MMKDTILRIKVPHAERPESYFSFQLKMRLENEAVQYSAPGKMLVISDIQGDFGALQRILIKCRVIDPKHHWIFDDGHLVIAGGGFDKDGKGVECLWLIYSLEEKAKRAGGYVHFILGSRELENLDGDWRHFHPNYANPRNGKTVVTALYDGNNALWQWMLTKNILEKIGDVLVMPHDVCYEMDRLDHWVRKDMHVSRRYSSFIRRLVNDPLLVAIFSKCRQETAGDREDWGFNQLGVRTIVLGQEMMEADLKCFNGRILKMNAGNTSGTPEGLLIKKNTCYRMDVNGNREKMNSFSF